LSIQSNSSDSFTSSSPQSRATGGNTATTTSTRGAAAAAAAGSIRSSSSPPILLSSSSPRPMSKKIQFPMTTTTATLGRRDLLRERTRSNISSQGSLFSFDSSTIATSTMQRQQLAAVTAATGLGYGCSRFLSTRRLGPPRHPESLEFVQEEEEEEITAINNSNNNEGTAAAWPQQMEELFRQDSWWTEDDTIKDGWRQELKQMEEKMKELLREEAPPPPTSKRDLAAVPGDDSGRRPRRTRGEKWKLRIGNHHHGKTEKSHPESTIAPPGAGAGAAKEAQAQLLQQIYDRLHSYNILGSLETTSGIPLEITQFSTQNDDSPIGNDNYSSQQKKTTPGHALSRKKSWKHLYLSSFSSKSTIQSPLLLDADQTQIEDDAIASQYGNKQSGERVRSMPKTLFRPRSLTSQSSSSQWSPQQRQDLATDTAIKNRAQSSPPPSPFAYWQQDAQSTASTPVWGNQLSHQEQQRRQAEVQENDDKNSDNHDTIPLAKQSSMRSVADAVVEGIIEWAASFDSSKVNNGPFVAAERRYRHAAFDSGKDIEIEPPGGARLLDPIVHMRPPPLIINGSDDRDEQFDTRAGKRISSFQRFRSRSPSATCSAPQKEASSSPISSKREVDFDGNEGRGSLFQLSRLHATTSVSSSSETRHKKARKVSNAAEDDSRRSASPILYLKTLVKPTPSSSRQGHDDDENDLDETLVSFGTDPSPLRRIRRKVRFTRHTSQKVIPYSEESVASIGDIVENFMVMTGCPVDPEAEYEEDSIISSDEDSTDGQGSSTRTDGSLNDSQTSRNGIVAMVQRSQSPVEFIGEAFRGIVETPPQQEGTAGGTGLEERYEFKKASSSTAEAPSYGIVAMIQRSPSPVELIGETLRAIAETPSNQEGTAGRAGFEKRYESKKAASSTTRVPSLQVLPRRLMRRALGRKKRPLSDPVILQRGNTVELMMNDTLANLGELLSQKDEKTCDGSSQVDTTTESDISFDDDPGVKQETSRLDDALDTVTLFSLGMASPTRLHAQQNKNHQPERQRSVVRFVKQILHRKTTSHQDDSKHVDVRKVKGAMDLNGGDSNDGRSLAVASTISALATKAEHSGPRLDGEGGANESAKRKQQENDDDMHDSPKHDDDRMLPTCLCVCNAFGNRSDTVPDQVVCESSYLSHGNLLARKGRGSLNMSEDHFDDYKRQPSSAGPHETSNAVPRLLGRGSVGQTAHQSQTDDDASRSDDSVNQMMVEWLVESLTFNDAENPLVKLFQCASPPISSSMGDWATPTLSCCKVDSHSAREWHQVVATPEHENDTRTMSGTVAKPQMHYPRGSGGRGDGDGIGDIHSDYSNVIVGKRTRSRRQELRRNRDRASSQGCESHSATSSPQVIPCRGLRDAEIYRMHGA
jgi:hypothetical protein